MLQSTSCTFDLENMWLESIVRASQSVQDTATVLFLVSNSCCDGKDTIWWDCVTNLSSQPSSAVIGQALAIGILIWGWITPPTNLIWMVQLLLIDHVRSFEAGATVMSRHPNAVSSTKGSSTSLSSCWDVATGLHWSSLTLHTLLRTNKTLETKGIVWREDDFASLRINGWPLDRSFPFFRIKIRCYCVRLIEFGYQLNRQKARLIVERHFLSIVPARH